MKGRRSFRQSGMRVAKRAWGGFKAARSGYNLAKKFKSAFGGGEKKSSTSGREAGDISRYHEDKVLYTKRRGNPRKRRAARRFNRKVVKTLMSNTPMKVMIRQYYKAEAWSPSGWIDSQHVCAALSLWDYGRTNTSDNYGDLYTVFVAEMTAQQQAQGAELHVRSVCMDIYLRNTTGAGTPIYVDIYYLVARKDNALFVLASDTLGAEMSNYVKPITGTSTGVTVGSPNWYGITPFQSPGFCEMWVITKKRRVYLDDGATFNFQIRDSKPRVIKGEIFSEQLLTRKGVTQQVMFVTSSPVINGGGTFLGGGSLSIFANKTMNYAMVAGTELTTAFSK